MAFPKICAEGSESKHQASKKNVPEQEEGEAVDKAKGIENDLHREKEDATNSHGDPDRQLKQPRRPQPNQFSKHQLIRSDGGENDFHDPVFFFIRHSLKEISRGGEDGKEEEEKERLKEVKEKTQITLRSVFWLRRFRRKQ